MKAYDYNVDTGNLSNPRVVLKFEMEKDGIPDGQCIDADGNLWIAMFFSSCVFKVDTTTGIDDIS